MREYYKSDSLPRDDDTSKGLIVNKADQEVFLWEITFLCNNVFLGGGKKSLPKCDDPLLRTT